jgi:y4mF family transcriptional regulator
MAVENASLPEFGIQDLAKAIRFHRKKAGLTQLELALLAGVGKTAIFDLEKNKVTPQLDTLIKVLTVLNIKLIFKSPLSGFIASEVTP